MTRDRVVCVLAGGRSKRFGRPKTHLRINDEPILAWQARRLTHCFDAALWLSLPPESDNPDLPPGSEAYERIVRDLVDYPGPLVAIEYLLTRARYAGVATLFIVPADMPLLTAADLSRLGERLSRDASKAFAMGVMAGGERAGAYQPLPLVCRVENAAPAVAEAVARGERAIKAIGSLPACAHLKLNEDADAAFTLNINRLEDIAAIEKRLGPNVRIS